MHFLLTNEQAINDYKSSGKYFINDIYGKIWAYIQESAKEGKFYLADLISLIQQTEPQNGEEIIKVVMDLSSKNEEFAPYSKETLDEILSLYQNEMNKQNIDETIKRSFIGKTPLQKALIVEGVSNQKKNQK